MSALDHGKCRSCERFCGCSFSPTTKGDHCDHHWDENTNAYEQLYALLRDAILTLDLEVLAVFRLYSDVRKINAELRRLRDIRLAAGIKLAVSPRP